MKRIFISIAMFFAVMPITAVHPCTMLSPPASLEWPVDQQKEVPLDAALFIDCNKKDCADVSMNLVDESGRTIEGEIKSLRYGVAFVPKMPFNPTTNYSMTFQGQRPNKQPFDQTITFTTGVSKMPPLSDIPWQENAEVIVEWVPNGKRAQIGGAGTCGYGEEREVAELTEEGLNLDEWEILSGHYNIIIKLNGLPNWNDDSPSHAGYISIENIWNRNNGSAEWVPSKQEYRFRERTEGNRAATVGTQKIYQLIAKDRWGNTSPEVLELTVDFNKEKSDFSLISKTMDVSPPPPPPPPPTNFADGGCNLMMKIDNVYGMSLGFPLIFLFTLLLVLKRVTMTTPILDRAKKSTGLLLALAFSLMACSPAEQEGIIGELPPTSNPGIVEHISQTITIEGFSPLPIEKDNWIYAEPTVDGIYIVFSARGRPSFALTVPLDILSSKEKYLLPGDIKIVVVSCYANFDADHSFDCYELKKETVKGYLIVKEFVLYPENNDCVG